jgi:hypothetical protein
MRKPRDFDADLKALTDKARQLKSRKQSQLGELVMATGADALPPEELVGALLDAAATDAARKEAWRQRGAAFFQKGGAAARSRARKLPGGTSPDDGGAPSASGPEGAE